MHVVACLASRLASVVVLLAVASRPGYAAPAVTPLLLTGQVAVGIYQQALPNDVSKLTSYEQAAGQHVAIVHWYAVWGGWKSAFSESDLDAVAERDSIPLITWEPWTGDAAPTPDPEWSLRRAILSGRSDAYIESWARGLAEYGRPVLLRFAQEMNDQPAYPWAVGVNGNTAEDYVAAWRHVHAIFTRWHADNVQWVWNPNDLGDAPASTYAEVYRSVYPGDDVVDWLGLDVFNTGPELNWGRPAWASFSDILAQPYAAISSLSDRPVILPEVGSTETGGSKATWLSSALTSELASFPRVRAVVWFDVQKEQPWNLDSSPASMQAWLRTLSQLGARQAAARAPEDP
ncbi:MAG: hypothetical protein JOY61_22060 [Chloroflexi bacterium]|nr:hypothetical protein [Chloroflexota bacterium]